MAILYALVARGSVILAELSAIKKTTNADVIAKKIAEKVPGDGSYFDNGFLFHVKRTDRLAFLCLAHKPDAQTLPFAFLEDIRQEFVRTYGAAARARAYDMNDAFSKVLGQKMEQYSNPNADRINRLRGKMSQLPKIEKLEVVLGGEDHQKLLVDTKEHMPGNTFDTRRRDHRFRSTAWWRKVEFWIAVIIILLVVVYVVLAFVCHGFTLPTCLKES